VFGRAIAVPAGQVCGQAPGQMIEEGTGTRRPVPDQAVQRQHQLFDERINRAVLLGEPDLCRPRRAQGLVGQVDVDAVQFAAELNREVLPRGAQERASGGDPTAEVRSADPASRRLGRRGAGSADGLPRRRSSPRIHP
jgi:hypothetical protein